MKNIALAAAVLAFSSATAFAADLSARPHTKAPTDTQRAFSPTGQYTVGQSSDVMEATIDISYKFGSTY